MYLKELSSNVFTHQTLGLELFRFLNHFSLIHDFMFLFHQW